jgi:hypothetical protein
MAGTYPVLKATVERAAITSRFFPVSLSSQPAFVPVLVC